MSDEGEGSSVHADDNSIAIGGISVGGNVGDVRIGHTIGYTSEQVSALITQISTTFQPKPFDGRCPYKGLDVFEEQDAKLFFGRKKWVKDLLSRIKESRTLFVTGQSGSGKSSLVRAGLIPALKTGYGSGWLYATMRPGRDPIEALANALSRLKDPGLGKYLRENVAQASALHECAESALSERADQRLVLFIDQFEEVFTQLSKDKAQTFIDMLDHAATVENGRAIILFAMRSDFVPNCATYPQLNAILNQQFVQIGAMGPEELVSAIAQPALRVGLKIDPDLIAQIINDMKGEPGALPLMQFALKDLFDAEQAKGGMIALTLSDYLERGGINQALERHANASLEKLTEEEKELARSVFSGLIEIGRGTQDTRRTALSNELIPAGAQAEAIKGVVQKLASARLITTDATTVTISHEKLIDAWPWLKKLINENRDVIALQNEIAEDAKEWEEHKRDSSYLYSGAKLATAREKMQVQTLVLGGLAQDFIEQSSVLQEAERKAKETLRRRIIIGLVSGIAIALMLAAFGFYQSKQASNNAATAQANLQAANTAQADAENQKNTAIAAQSTAVSAKETAVANEQEAKRQATISRAGELASLGLTERNNNFLQALLLGLEGYHTYSDSRTKSTLFTLFNSRPELVRFLQGHTAQVNSVAFSPDNKLLASGSNDDSIILWDFSDPENPVQLSKLTGHSAGITTLAFNPAQKWLASGSDDRNIIIWDISNLQAPSKLATLSGHTNAVTSVAFSPDGTRIASGSWDDSIILWDVSNPNTPSQLAVLPSQYSVISSVAFSPDGNRLASGTWSSWGFDSITLWDISDPNSPSPLTTYGSASGVTSVAFNPNGNLLASGSWDGSTVLWNVGNPDTPLATLSGHSAGVTSVAFSSDGERLASGSEDKSIIVWDVSNPNAPSQITTLTGHSNAVSSVAFSGDGNQLVSGSWDASIILWNVGSSNLRTPAQLVMLAEENTQLSKTTFSKDGKLIASGGRDTQQNTGFIQLWDIENPAMSSQPTRLPIEGNSVYSVAFSPDGTRLVSGGWNTSTILWDITNIEEPNPLATLTGKGNIIDTLAFSPDGKLIAGGSENYTITLWDASNPNSPLAVIDGHSSAVFGIAFSPDGKQLASGSKDGSIKLWDVSNPTNPSLLATLRGNPSAVISIALSLDGKLLASGSNDQSITLWDVSNPKTPSQISNFVGHTAKVNSVTFDPNGNILASASEDKSIILWDINDPKVPSEIAYISGQSAAMENIGFSSDGKELVSGSFDGSVILWDSDIQSWAKKACQRVGRNFTLAEWAQYFVGEDYRMICGDLPKPSDITITPPIDTRGNTGFTINDVNINNTGNFLTVTPGTPIDITYNFEVFNYICAGCITQLVTGLGQPDTTGDATKCAYDSIPGLFPGKTGTEDITIITPSTPGTYPVVVEYQWQSSCEDAIKMYGTGNSAMPPQIIGQIIVSASP